MNFYNTEYLKNSFIDYFIIGEGEYALPRIINREIKEKVIHASQIKGLNNLSFPKYKLFDLSSYERKNGLSVLLSRGCINKCNFCFERILYKTYRSRAPEHVIEEIKYHTAHNKIHWFTFYDSLFNGNLKYLEKLLKLIIKNKLEIIWDAQIGIRHDMDDGLLKLIKKSGCVNLFIGLESGSKYILKQMNKNFTLPQASRFLKRLSGNNINFETSLILNYPFESKEHVEETTRFLLKNRRYIKKIAQVNPYIYYPGTNAYINNLIV